MAMYLLSLADKDADFIIQEHEEVRSEAANAYYWSCVVAPAVEANIGYTAAEFNGEMEKKALDGDDLHELWLHMFATTKHYELLNRETGEIIAVDDVKQRSSNMTGKSFYDFVEQVRQHLAEFHGVMTADPDPQYWRKRTAA